VPSLSTTVQRCGPVWGFLEYFENSSPDNVRNQAQSYLLRVVVLTDATEMGDGYLLNVR